MIPLIIHLAIALAGVLVAIPIYYSYCTEQEKKEGGFACYRNSIVFSVIIAVSFLLCFAFTLTLPKDSWFDVLCNVQNQLFWCIVLLIAAIDFKVKKIPNLLSLSLFVIRVLFILVTVMGNVYEFKEIVVPSLIGLVSGALFMGVCYFFARGGVGAGDLKLYAVLGFCYGLVGLVAIMLYSLLASVFVGVGLLISKKAKFKTAIPMAPFIIFGLTLYLVLVS